MDAKADDEWMEEAEVMSEVHIGSGVGVKSTLSYFSMSPLVDTARRQFADVKNIERRNVEPGAEAEAEADVDEDKEDDGGEVEVDEQGDLVLRRRRKLYEIGDAIVIHHHLTSRLPQVGLQVWRGALLLSDFIFHKMCTTTEFTCVTALELGAGTGLAGLVMAQVAPLVFITDKGFEILDNCSRNIFLNRELLRNGESTVRVRELDWQMRWPLDIVYNESSHLSSTYQWNVKDMKDVGEVSVLLAADVVYTPDITQAFFDILKMLMPLNSNKVLYLTIEKRYNFSLSELDVVAHGYKHFRSFFDSNLQHEDKYFTGSNRQGIHEKSSTSVGVNMKSQFYGKKLDINAIPQYITNYQRGEDLELWEIRPQAVVEDQMP